MSLLDDLSSPVSKARFLNVIQKNEWFATFFYFVKRARYGLALSLLNSFVHFFQIRILSSYLDLSFLYDVFFVQIIISIYGYALLGGFSFLRIKMNLLKSHSDKMSLFHSEFSKTIVSTCILAVVLSGALLVFGRLESPRFNVFVLSIWFLILVELPLESVFTSFRALVMAKKRLYIPIWGEVVASVVYLLVIWQFFLRFNYWGILIGIVTKFLIKNAFVLYYLKRDLISQGFAVAKLCRFTIEKVHSSFALNSVVHLSFKIFLLLGSSFLFKNLLESSAYELYIISPVIVFLVFLPQGLHFDFFKFQNIRSMKLRPALLVKLMTFYLATSSAAALFIGIHFLNFRWMALPFFTGLVFWLTYYLAYFENLNCLKCSTLWRYFVFRDEAIFKKMQKKNNFYLYEVTLAFLKGNSQVSKICHSMALNLDENGIIFNRNKKLLVAASDSKLEANIEFLRAGEGYIVSIKRSETDPSIC